MLENAIYGNHQGELRLWAWDPIADYRIHVTVVYNYSWLYWTNVTFVWNNVEFYLNLPFRLVYHFMDHYTSRDLSLTLKVRKINLVIQSVNTRTDGRTDGRTDRVLVVKSNDFFQILNSLIKGHWLVFFQHFTDPCHPKESVQQVRSITTDCTVVLLVNMKYVWHTVILISFYLWQEQYTVCRDMSVSQVSWWHCLFYKPHMFSPPWQLRHHDTNSALLHSDLSAAKVSSLIPTAARSREMASRHLVQHLPLQRIPPMSSGRHSSSDLGNLDELIRYTWPNSPLLLSRREAGL